MGPFEAAGLGAGEGVDGGEGVVAHPAGDGGEVDGEWRCVAIGLGGDGADGEGGEPLAEVGVDGEGTVGTLLVLEVA